MSWQGWGEAEAGGGDLGTWRKKLQGDGGPRAQEGGGREPGRRENKQEALGAEAGNGAVWGGGAAGEERREAGGAMRGRARRRGGRRAARWGPSRAACARYRLRPGPATRPAYRAHGLL